MNITVTHWEQNTLSHFLFYSLLGADCIFNIVQDNKGSTVWSHIHMRAHTLLSQFRWWVICHSASIQILHCKKKKKNWSCTPWLSCFLTAWRKGPAVGHDCTTTLTQLIWNLIKLVFHKQLTLLIHVPCILPRRYIQMLSRDNNNSLKPSSHDIRCGLVTSTTFLSHSTTQA